MKTSDFLVEIGCEELPTASVLTVSQAFSNVLLTQLDKVGLSHDTFQTFATPRRFGLLVKGLQCETPSQKIVRKGPAVKAAYGSDGQPTKAALGFAQSCGVDIKQLSTTQSDKGEWLVHEFTQPGQNIQENMGAWVEEVLKQLPISKPMRWGEALVSFVRPIHWILMMLDDRPIQANMMGIESGSQTFGHRFHHPEAIMIETAASYENQLKDAFVMPTFSERRQNIVDQVSRLADKHGAKAILPDELLDEITSIVEWPHALCASFQADLLKVPQEALIASMQSHQKCIALIDKRGQLQSKFITVANIQSKDDSAVIKGNEKVMDARLKDAAFFYQQDKSQPFDQFADLTEGVVFQKKLGTLKEKSDRMGSLLKTWSKLLGIKPALAARSAELSKADLMTGMVGEFPELQGIMGASYAKHHGENESVSLALMEQYLPRFSGDRLPQSPLGMALSLADRMDTLVGIFAIGEKPTGTKDPFKLRRHALAVVRLLCETTHPLSLSQLIEQSMKTYQSKIDVSPDLASEVKPFILDRFRSHLMGLGYSSEEITSVLVCQDDDLFDAFLRLKALHEFIKKPEAESLTAACKRVKNLLNGASPPTVNFSEKLLRDDAEKALYQAVVKTQSVSEPCYLEKNYEPILTELASLKGTVDEFFDQVMVMVEDEKIKNNRLHLLSHLQKLLSGVADISVLHLG